MEKYNEKELNEAGRDNINSNLGESERIVKEGIDSIRPWAEKLKDRFGPAEQKSIEFNESDVVATLTKMGSVILTFSTQDDAKKYFDNIK